MSRAFFRIVVSFLLTTGFVFSQYKIHDMSRPVPAVIDPGFPGTPKKPGQPPSDAVILFNGISLDQWRTLDGAPARWKVENGYMETIAGTGPIRTVQCFGDCQLHVEWCAPVSAEGSSQGRGNSGVFLMGKYEIQVLDSYQNRTYADGQAAAIYGEFPPLVNACRKPGEWQTYDIIFRRPIFAEIVKPARITVLHNGVLVHDHVDIKGPTAWLTNLAYSPHADELPLSLQDHNNPVRYRNIWIRPLPDPVTHVRVIALPDSLLDRYIGVYERSPGANINITNENGRLMISIHEQHREEMFAGSEQEFFLKKVDIQIKFDPEHGKVTGLTLYQGGGKMIARKL